MFYHDQDICINYECYHKKHTKSIFINMYIDDFVDVCRNVVCGIKEKQLILISSFCIEMPALLFPINIPHTLGHVNVFDRHNDQI